MILAALAVVLLVAVIVAPQWWVRSAMTRHAAERPDLPGTGGELARHLLDLAGLQEVPVEVSAAGDHYDPIDRVVRLSPVNHDGRSITAVAVAAHEASHAMQHADGDRRLLWRTRLAGSARGIEVAAAVVLALAPLAAIVVRSPALFLVQVGVVVLLLGSRAMIHVLTLPMELDASFGRALPILQRGRFLQERDLPAARTVLRAAALTYVAAALMTMIDVARLLRVLRF